MSVKNEVIEKCRCGCDILVVRVTVPGFGSGSKLVKRCSNANCHILITERKKSSSIYGFGVK